MSMPKVSFILGSPELRGTISWVLVAGDIRDLTVFHSPILVTILRILFIAMTPLRALAVALNLFGIDETIPNGPFGCAGVSFVVPDVLIEHWTKQHQSQCRGGVVIQPKGSGLIT